MTRMAERYLSVGYVGELTSSLADMKKKKRYSIFELAARHAKFDILAYIEKKWKECTDECTGAPTE